MHEIYGLVLAGGRSERMGSDKGALHYHGTDQAHYMAQLLAPYVGDTYISVRREQLGAAHLQGLKTLSDHYAAASPLNGIVSAMRRHAHAAWLVVAVDMPYVTCAALETLLAQRDATAVATCFESPAKGGPDPLLALWESHAFAALEQHLLQGGGHACPRSALKKLGAHILQNAVAPQVLRNINTPQERQAS
jgi:molybdopterin-guanine dinucleotide biosynthesis protein A